MSAFPCYYFIIKIQLFCSMPFSLYLFRVIDSFCIFNLIHCTIFYCIRNHLNFFIIICYRFGKTYTVQGQEVR